MPAQRRGSSPGSGGARLSRPDANAAPQARGHPQKQAAHPADCAAQILPAPYLTTSTLTRMLMSQVFLEKLDPQKQTAATVVENT